MRGKNKIKWWCVALSAAAMLASLPMEINVQASGCPDVKIIFARGSGGERWNDQNYLAFRNAIDDKLKTTSVRYEFLDLDYPAVGVGVENLGVTVGAFFGGGEAYEFGDSVKTGVNNLTQIVNSSACPNTKYALGGYSQGAMVISKALPNLNANKIIYAATFGDPKLYLPEGKGFVPAACASRNLSDYRVYVPDCQAYEGLLGAIKPYRPESLKGKVGTWCNKGDIFCSSHMSVRDHTSYVADNLYEDAAKVIVSKITAALSVENHVTSLHDVAIVLDSSGSMQYLMDEYKAEALKLARETLQAGGRIALYDYRDLDDPYEPVQHCVFETCTLEIFEQELNNITIDGGGDTPESLLSASYKVMDELHWRQGSTKSLVVLTDANFLSPDRDRITLDQVVKLSNSIDPVNFYVVTANEFADDYAELTERTDGKVITTFEGLHQLTDDIMARFDTLPRVEMEDVEVPLTTIGTKFDKAEWLDATTAKIEFTTNAPKNLVILNDAVLGFTTESSVVFKNLRPDVENIVKLIPFDDERKGATAEIVLTKHELGVPNTGCL